ncbi:MAG: hypothetical protein V3S64_14045 [bacterium]
MQRAYDIENGRTVLEGSKDQLLNDPDYSNKFLGLDWRVEISPEKPIKGALTGFPYPVVEGWDFLGRLLAEFGFLQLNQRVFVHLFRNQHYRIHRSAPGDDSLA